jgi:hypothetical protein
MPVVTILLLSGCPVRGKTLEREELVARITLTVYFENPFWVGVVERQADGALQAARHIFGAEPSPGEVLEFVQRQLGPLLDRPSIAVAVAQAPPRPLNPKRAARAAALALAERGLSTQSQEALRLQIEQHKRLRKQRSKAEREAAAAYKRQLKTQKAKARHRGR